MACGLWCGSCPVAQRKVLRKFIVFVEGSYPPPPVVLACGLDLVVYIKVRVGLQSL